MSSNLNLVRATARMAGRVMSSRGQPRAVKEFSLDALEPRQLLGVDHPSFAQFPAATAITLNGNGEGNVSGVINSTTDDDMFSFVAPATDFVSILADTVNSPGSTLNSRVEVYNSAGTRINFTDNSVARGLNNGTLTSGVANDGWFGFIATAGDQYFIRVRSENNTQGDYQVFVDAQSSSLETLPAPTPPPFGPTPPFFDATGIVNQGLGQIRDIIARAQQDIVYKFDLTNTATVPALADAVYDSLFTVAAQARLPGDPTPAAIIDTRIDVYDQAGNLIKVDSDSGNLNDAYVTFRSRLNSTFFFRVRSDKTNPADAASTGAYTLTFDASATQVAVDPVVRYGGRVTGNAVGGVNDGLGSAQDTAIFSFIAQGTGLSIITVVGAGLPPLQDPAIRLLDENGTLIRFNDDFNGLNSQMLVALQGGKKYYVIVDTFDNVSGGNFYLAIESNHTNDSVAPYQPGAGVDDHVNAPGERATPLIFGAPFETLDANFNRVLDIGFRVTASNTGRIEGTGDTDLFQFTVPKDLLNTFTGNDDNAGTALYVGGGYNIADRSVVPEGVGSRSLSAYDAFNYWFVGAQKIDPRLANPPPGTRPLGFNDNAGTGATAGPEIYVLYKWQPPGTSGDNSQVLIVGGDFDLIVPTNNPLAPQIIQNLAVWAFNPQAGRYVWTKFTGADPNGPVRAITLFDPEAPWDPPTNLGGPTEARPDPFDQQLIIGGDFTNLGPRLARRAGNAWTGINLGINDGSVFALEVFDPPAPTLDVTVTTTPPGGPPTVTQQDLQVDFKRSLFVGGSFTASQGGRALVAWDGTAVINEARFPNGAVNVGGTITSWTKPAGWLPTQGVTGTVFALKAFDPVDVGGFTLNERLIIGGQFANANGIAANNISEWGVLNTETANGTPPRTLVAQPYGASPRDAGAPLGTPRGTDGPVFALALWDPIDTAGDPVVDGIRLAIGGQFTNFGGIAFNNIATDSYWASFTIALSAFDVGVNSAVRTFTSFADDQEPGIPAGQNVLYFGGNFTTTAGQGLRLNRVGAWFFNTATQRWVMSSLRGGVGTTTEAQPETPSAAIAVYALSDFDDGISGQWDRNERPAPRPQITVAPTTDSFLDTFVRVFDSRGVLIYSNDNTDSDFISTNFEADQNPTDPSGSKDPRIAPPGYEVQWVLPGLWAGETYYIEVSGQGTGRYTISITMEADPSPDVNGDVVYDNINASQRDVPNYGNWAATLARAELDIAPTTGDVTNIKTGNTVAFNQDEDNVIPSLGGAIRRLSEQAAIESLLDTDVYVFRPNFTGQIEIRINTSNITRLYNEALVGASRTRTGNVIQELGGLTKEGVNSWLDSYLRVYDNDFNQLNYNDNNYAVTGLNQSVNVGTNTRIFWRRDARIVMNVVAGSTYFVEVGSAQRYIDGSLSDVAARNDPANQRSTTEINWANALGAYELLLHTQAFIPTDVENSQTIQDDHVNFPVVGANPVPNINAAQIASVIRINGDIGNPANGTGSITGTINNTPNNPADNDGFSLLAPGSGNLAVTVTRAAGSTLIPALRIYSFDAATNIFNIVAAGVAVGNGTLTLNVPAVAGQQYYINVAGSGPSEGDYTISIGGTIPARDDAPDYNNIAFSPEITLRDFLGSGTISGNIEVPGDSDTFKFVAFGYHTVRATVTGLDSTLNPAFIVYEVSEDAAGNPYFTVIAFNDDLSANSTNASVTFSVNPNRTSLFTGSTYPYYYIEVLDSNRQTGFGRYRLDLSFPATDDHPDAGEYDFATLVVVDPLSGLGASTGNIEKVGDTDLFRFTAPATGTGSITIDRPSSSIFRPRVSLIDQDRTTVIATFDGADSTTLYQATVTSNLVRGRTYFILVEGISGGTVTSDFGLYTVSITTAPQDDHANATEWTLATPIGLNTTSGDGSVGTTSGPNTSNPRLNYIGDTDLFTFTTIRPGNAVITITPFNTSLGNLAPRVEIYSSTFTLVGSATASGAGSTAAVQITGTLTGQKYYILVLADGAGSSTGEYRVFVDTPDSGGNPPPPPDGEDPGIIDFNTPRDIVLSPRTGDGSITDLIDVARDRDLFRFVTPNRAGRVFVQVITPLGAVLDAKVTILNAANESAVLTSDADGIPGVSANVTFDGAANTTYYIIVAGVGNGTGSYSIKVNALPVTTQLVFPEGYATTKIREFVPIVNSNSFAVNYRVILRYDDNTPDLLAYTRTAAPNSRDGVTIINAEGERVPGLMLNKPYSIIVESDAQLGATFAHYDFGATLGDAFTERTSNTWTFPRIERDSASVRDYLVVYNPNNFEVTLTLTAYQTGGTAPVIITRNVPALKRGGFSIDAEALLPTGVFGIVLTSRAANPANESSNIGIVASISHYNLTDGSGFSALGDPDGGSTRGALGIITNGPTASSDLTFLNPTDRPITVNLVGQYVRASLPAINFVFDVPAGSVRTFTGAGLGITDDQPVGLTYTTTTAPIVALINEVRYGDGDASQSTNTAGTNYFFGDAFIDARDAGVKTFDFLYLYNPASAGTTINVRLIFADGSTPFNTSVSIGANGYGELRLHELPVITSRPGNTWYSVQTTSNTPFMTWMTHYDLRINGGYTQSPVAFGILNPISGIA
jgi:hypothetical protein